MWSGAPTQAKSVAVGEPGAWVVEDAGTVDVAQELLGCDIWEAKREGRGRLVVGGADC